MHDATREATASAGAQTHHTAVSLDELRETMARLGLTSREALWRLETEILLAREAERLGYAQHPAVVEVVRQAAVQTLLVREVETSSDGADEASLLDETARAARFEALLETIERRTSVVIDPGVVDAALWSDSHSAGGM